MIPKVSILICAYNSGKYIERCLKSVISQTYKNIEIICVDDNSSDNTFKIMKRFQKKDKRISIYKNSTNKGIAFNRNFLISVSHGEYFFFLDSDDWMNKKACQYLLKYTKGKDYDIVVGKARTVFEKFPAFKIKFFPTSSFRKHTTNFEYIKKNILLCWGCFINRFFWNSLKVSFNESGAKKFEDLGLMPFIFFKAKRFLTIYKIIYFYFRRKNSASKLEGNNFEQVNDILAQIDYLLNVFKKNKLLENKKNREIVASSLYAPMGFILFFNIPEGKESKMIYAKTKMEFLYLIVKKYGIEDLNLVNLKINNSVWKRMLSLFFRITYRKQFKRIKQLELSN